MTDCPTCGHAVKVVGDTTQHYEPVGCHQIVDDHQVCDEQLSAARAETERWRAIAKGLVDALEVCNVPSQPSKIATVTAALAHWRVAVNERRDRSVRP